VSKVIISLYDLVIMVPLSIENTIKKNTDKKINKEESKSGELS